MPVKTKSIVVWGCEDLLSSSVEFLLASQKDWKVVSISSQEDIGALYQAVETTHPDTVIIHLGEHSNSTNLPLHLLQDYPDLQVITISFENNALEVYSRQKILVKEASNLISIIENGHSTQ